VKESVDKYACLLHTCNMTRVGRRRACKEDVVKITWKQNYRTKTSRSSLIIVQSIWEHTLITSLRLSAFNISHAVHLCHVFSCSMMVHQEISHRVLSGATYDPGHWTFYFCWRRFGLVVSG
jgi:hypothetical protein